MDEQSMNQIKSSLAMAQGNREQAIAQANYWKGWENALLALLALLEPPKPPEKPKPPETPKE